MDDTPFSRQEGGGRSSVTLTFNKRLDENLKPVSSRSKFNSVSDSNHQNSPAQQPFIKESNHRSSDSLESFEQSSYLNNVSEYSLKQSRYSQLYFDYSPPIKKFLPASSDFKQQGGDIFDSPLAFNSPPTTTNNSLPFIANIKTNATPKR